MKWKDLKLSPLWFDVRFCSFFLGQMSYGVQKVFRKWVVSFIIKEYIKKFILKFWAKGTQNWSKTSLFKFCEKSVHETFLIFCIKLQRHECLKLTQMIFCEKSYTGVFRQKRAQNEFCKFNNKMMHWVFLFFYVKLQQLQKFLFCFFLGQKGLKMELA